MNATVHNRQDSWETLLQKVVVYNCAADCVMEILKENIKHKEVLDSNIL